MADKNRKDAKPAENVSPHSPEHDAALRREQYELANNTSVKDERNPAYKKKKAGKSKSVK